MNITIIFKNKNTENEFEADAKYAPEIAEILINIAEKEKCKVVLDGDSSKVVDLAQYLLENNVEVEVSKNLLPLLEERLEKERIDAYPPTGKVNFRNIAPNDLPF